MKKLRFALALLALAVVGTPTIARADGWPSAFYSGSTGTCGFTGHMCGGDGCEYDCEQEVFCFGPWDDGGAE